MIWFEIHEASTWFGEYMDHFYLLFSPTKQNSCNAYDDVMCGDMTKGSIWMGNSGANVLGFCDVAPGIGALGGFWLQKVLWVLDCNWCMNLWSGNRLLEWRALLALGDSRSRIIFGTSLLIPISFYGLDDFGGTTSDILQDEIDKLMLNTLSWAQIRAVDEYQFPISVRRFAQFGVRLSRTK